MKLPFILSWLLAMTAGGAETEPVVWNFDSGETGWRPRAGTITIERDASDQAVIEGHASLRVRGRIDVGYNYANSDRRPMLAGRLYRLSARVRVESLGAGTPPPFLKCEFVAADPRKNLNHVVTSAYDLQQPGTWQPLSCEFAAPEGTVACWVALEKGTSHPAEIDAWIHRVRIEPIQRLSVLDQFQLDPLSAALAARRGLHPRLYLDAARVAALRARMTTSHAALWRDLLAQADQAVRSGPPAYRKFDKTGNDEQLWQRNVGNAMPSLAMAWLLTGDRKFLDAARAWALASCGYATWGLGRRDGMDLAAGHQLFGLGIVYDWCYADLDEAARRVIRETLVRRGSAMFLAAATGKAGWHRAYLQNHLWVNVCGLAVAGLAISDENPEALCWVALALDKFRRTADALGPDGASHEGVGYWGYGVEYMLKFMHLSRELLGVDLYDRPWWRHTAAYRLYLSLPRHAWTARNCIVDIADSPRGNWYGPDYLLRGLAREFHDGHAQWLAAQIDEAHVASPSAGWLNLIWFDPAIVPRAPGDLPTLRHFEDMGIVSARSDWSGDESLAVFKCGPFIGHEAVRKFRQDPGGGHVHPDANHFVFFGNGEWLIRDDGYRPKFTSQHNTLLIDGCGQLGEKSPWFDGAASLSLKSCPRILRADSTPSFDHMVGDATAAYPGELGLRRFTRHLLFAKPDVLIVVDDIELDKERALELRFHPENTGVRETGGVFLMQGVKALLRLEPLTRQGVSLAAAEQGGQDPHSGKAYSMFSIRLGAHRARWRNAVALSSSPADGAPVCVRLAESPDRWTFTAGAREIALDWNTGKATEAQLGFKSRQLVRPPSPQPTNKP